MSKILITGSEGSLMQATIPYLIKNGHEVIGVDNLSRYNKRLNIADKKAYEFFKEDLLDYNTVTEIFHAVKPDVVIQAAANIYGVGGFHTHAGDIITKDTAIQGNVLRAIQDTQGKVEQFVFISSSMVYENTNNSFGISKASEDMVDLSPAPKTHYGLSKYVNEKMITAFWSPYTIWRPFNILTPYETAGDIQGDSHVFADFIKSIVIDNRTEIEIIGDGNQVRCFTWIEDVAKVIANGIFNQSPIPQNTAFNIGNHEPITMIQLAEIINEEAYKLGLVPNKELDFLCGPAYNDDVRYRVPDTSKLEEYLVAAKTPWKPQKTRQSIFECLKYLKEKTND